MPISASQRRCDDSQRDPEALLLDRVDAAVLARRMASLPGEYREILLLREIEDLSYRDIAEITASPMASWDGCRNGGCVDMLRNVHPVAANSRRSPQGERHCAPRYPFIAPR